MFFCCQIIFHSVCSFNTPTVLYLQHHRSNSEGWESLILCNNCAKEIVNLLQPMVGNCTPDPSCRCNVCLRPPPSLRNLVSHTVFHYTYNLSEFILTDRTLYHQYLYAFGITGSFSGPVSSRYNLYIRILEMLVFTGYTLWYQ